MKLCEGCADGILKSGESWDYHKCYACLKESSEWVVAAVGEPSSAHSQEKRKKSEKKERCLFCWTLRHDIETIEPHLKAHHGPIYRWNMRTLAKIRESLETVVITFRQIPNEKKEGDTVVEEIKLPTRTFYLFPEDEISPLPTFEELGTSTNPAVNGGSQIKSWIETCDSTHLTCTKRRKAMSASSQFVPTRLLDIGGPPKSPIKIIEKATTPVRGPYVSLSHCWGPNPTFVQLNPETREQFMTEGVPWQRFPKNFKEAIEVARLIGIEYIWIDSLCIIQGDDGDFPSEAPKMHNVYRNSYCNISIVDSGDSRGGVFRNRDPEDVAPVRYQAEDESTMFGKTVWRIVPGDLWESDLLRTKLYVRGWVFQERMLSPRILHFAKRQVFWDCPSMSACESLPSGLPPPMDGAARPDRHWRNRLQEPEKIHGPLAGASDDSLEDFWKTAIYKYTSCALTKGEDKKIAMWGIAKLVRDAWGVEYGEGLWEESLEDQLTWQVAECTLHERPSESTDKSIARDIPSWSWASMDGPIEVADRITKIMPHYRVTDHYGRRLTFDLKGVKRYLSPTRPKSRDGTSPTQTRGMSDTDAELKRRNKELEKEDGDGKVDKAEEIDRNAEPKFHSKSIQIYGHVGRGRLQKDRVNKRWLLGVDGLTGVEVEAFPDTIPKEDSLVDQNPFFVVLSAKKINPGDSREGSAESVEDELQEETDPDEPVIEVPREFEYFGAGIIMKDVGGHHFKRTGAFRFRNVNADVFAQLIGLRKTYKSTGLPPNLYPSSQGQRFWLD